MAKHRPYRIARSSLYHAWEVWRVDPDGSSWPLGAFLTVAAACKYVEQRELRARLSLSAGIQA